MSPRTPWLRSPVPLALLLGLGGLVLLLPGLGDHGIWSNVELPVYDRVRAALGEALRDLERHPWLPELIRTRTSAMAPGALGLRLSHAVAAAGLGALATGLARFRGATLSLSMLAGVVALAFPTVVVVGRTALGNPIGELCTTAAIVLGLVALAATHKPRAITWAVAAASVLALAVASAGLVIGGALPLAVLAVAALLGPRRNPWAAIGLGTAALVALTTAVMLSLDQGDGYIPLLGASKDLLLVDKPEGRRFAAGVEDLGYALYPWAPLAIAGALLGYRDKLPALWLGLGVAMAGGWSLVYGITPLPIAVPAALSVVAAVEWVGDPKTDRTGRRAALAVVILATLVLRKDAEHSPSRLAVPMHEFEGEHTFPNDELEASDKLARLGGLALLSIFGIGLLAPAGGPSTRFDRLLDRLPAGPRGVAPALLVGVAAVAGATTYAHQIVPDLCNRLSPRLVLEHHRALVQAGALPEQLGNHRVRDAGLALYGPGDVASIGSRRELANYLDVPQPRAAIIRARDLPSLHQDHRAKGWPLFVLDDRHAHLRLVANRLPEGEVDLNPIPSVVFDEPPQLAHQTRLQFEQYIEIIGWEMTDPIVRGREVEFQLAIRVLRPLPGGSKLYARLLKDRTSRLNTDPHELTDGIYPPNLWREGDYILHRFSFKAPLLEIQPGPHELVVGLRRGEKQNFGISVPEANKGEFGVRVRDKKRNFARIGTVEVW